MLIIPAVNCKKKALEGNPVNYTISATSHRHNAAARGMGLSGIPRLLLIAGADRKPVIQDSVYFHFY